MSAAGNSSVPMTKCSQKNTCQGGLWHFIQESPDIWVSPTPQGVWGAGRNKRVAPHIANTQVIV